jgi:hypothetical protein
MATGGTYAVAYFWTAKCNILILLRHNIICTTYDVQHRNIIQTLYTIKIGHITHFLQFKHFKLFLHFKDEISKLN